MPRLSIETKAEMTGKQRTQCIRNNIPTVCQHAVQHIILVVVGGKGNVRSQLIQG